MGGEGALMGVVLLELRGGGRGVDEGGVGCDWLLWGVDVSGNAVDAMGGGGGGSGTA